VDDPTIPNLVFKWVGAPFNATGGPFPDVIFSGLTAKSIFGGIGLDGFSALTVTNNGAATGKLAANDGSVGVPAEIMVPEPASWTLMILGFGGVGAALRARRKVRPATA
jgi:hypothetical protein